MTSTTIDRRPGPRARLATWLDRWGAVLPLFAAEFIVLAGFGALLPILPLYMTEQGIDLATLGIVVAAWPAARLVTEPVFGWLADRTARVPWMVAGLVVSGLAGALPLVWTGALPFIILRAIAGLGAAMYDPAARGYLTDSTPPERRGEAFGLYGAAQMGGFLVGPAIGALGAEHLGGVGFVFVFSGIASIVAAVAIAVRLDEERVARRSRPGPTLDRTDFPPDAPYIEERAASTVAATSTSELASVSTSPAAADAAAAAFPSPAAPTSLLNRGLLAVVVLNIGSYFSSGTYEVVWSLFLEGLGADLGLIGLTFALWGLPVLLVSPLAGRFVDRRGPFPFIVIGSIIPAITGIAYTFLVDPVLSIPLILVEATGFALLSPALFQVVSTSSPAGRSSTAQGIFGAAGTLGFIVASVVTGALAAHNILWPFYLFSAVMTTCLVIGLAIGGERLRDEPVGIAPG